MKKITFMTFLITLCMIGSQAFAQTPNLMITEIMYNGPESGTDSTEFIEIFNNDTMSVNLTGYHFVQGVNYTFPAVTINPNSYIVVAVDSVKFVNFFGTTAYEWTSGGLSNGGEDIILVNSTGDTVDVVDYNDANPWPTSAADGGGHSITFCDVSLDNNDGANWSIATNFVDTNAVGDSIWSNPGMGCGAANPPQLFKVLVVDDDANGTDESSKIITAIGNAGHTYSSFNISTSFPIFDTLIKYDMVIWTTANDGYNLYLWDVSDTAANGIGAVKFNAPLMQYLDSNGVVWVDGVDYFYDIYGAAPDTFTAGDFVYDVMGISVYAAQSHVDEPAGLSLAVKSTSNTITNLDSIQWKWSTLWNADAFDITQDAVSLYEMGPSSYTFAGKTIALYHGNLISSSLRIASFGDASGNYVQSDVDSLVSDMINAAILGTFAPIPITVPVGDTVAPVVNSVDLINGTSLLVVYSEAVDTSSENVNNYSGLGTIASAVLNANGDTVTLTLAAALTDGATSVLTIANVKDTTGNAMLNAQSFTFLYNAISTKLLITEIMYNDVSASDSLEYFEIHNNTGSAINIGGFEVTEGVSYTFPANTMLAAGAYLVIAKDSTLVNSVFGISGTHQWVSGGLKNSGEDIEIKNTVGDTIAYVDYDDSGVWPSAPDGNGPSLTFCNYSLNNNNGSNWSAATSFAAVIAAGDSIWANPGTGCGSTPPPSSDTIPPVVNNVNTISGISFNVYFSEPVDPSAEVVTNYTGLGLVSSAVRSANGDMVTLTLATALMDGAAYTLTVANVKDTANNSMTTPQNFDILFNGTTANLLLTEIMYNDLSATDSLEYFEIYNNGSSTVNLGGYMVTEGVHFVFPANSYLTKGSYLVVAKDSALVNSVFGISGTYQWTSGGLKNSGEDIEIQNSLGDTLIYVDYDDSSPWPVEADGDGPSIEYCDLSVNAGDNNNDGSFWTKSVMFVAIFNGDTIFGTPGTGCFMVSIDNQENTAKDISIYPNPTNDIININTDGEEYSVKIFNTTGSLVKEITINGTNSSINLSSLNKGMYYLQFVNNKTLIRTVKKLIVE